MIQSPIFLDEKEQEEMSDFYNSFKIKLDKQISYLMAIK